jgi:hypothetical protein
MEKEPDLADFADILKLLLFEEGWVEEGIQG